MTHTSSIQTEGLSHVVTRWQPGQHCPWPTTFGVLANANLVHAPEWHDIIQRSYGHTPIYLTAKDSYGNIAGLPAFLIKRPAGGNVIASLPFLDSGGPCGTSNSLTGPLVERLLEIAKQMQASRIDLRSSVPLDIGIAANFEKVSLALPLASDPEVLWHRLNAKVRNQVRKAERCGLRSACGGAELLGQFYEVFLVNMRHLGSPVHSRQFFEAIFDAFGERARVTLVLKENKAVGGLIALAFHDRLSAPWASSLRTYFPMCPNMLMYWRALKDACMEGFRTFDFGRSSRDSGTYRFKRQWGAHDEQLYWYTIRLGGKAAFGISKDRRSGQLSAQIWTHLPLGLTRWMGPKIRKYLTQ